MRCRPVAARDAQERGASRGCQPVPPFPKRKKNLGPSYFVPFRFGSSRRTMADLGDRQDLSRAARAAMQTPQGRKRRGASIAIPLKPREKPVNLPSDVKKSLRNELDVRYLESIGAAPSKTNLAMVRKHIPPDKCTFSTAWKSRGWISDTLFITLQDPKDAAPVVAARRHRRPATATPPRSCVVARPAAARAQGARRCRNPPGTQSSARPPPSRR